MPAAFPLPLPPTSFFIGGTTFLALLSLATLVQCGLSIISLKRTAPARSRLPFLLITLTFIYAVGWGINMINYLRYYPGLALTLDQTIALFFALALLFPIADFLLSVSIVGLILDRWRTLYEPHERSTEVRLPRSVMYGAVGVLFSLQVAYSGITYHHNRAIVQGVSADIPELRDAMQGLSWTTSSLDLANTLIIVTYTFILRGKVRKLLRSDSVTKTLTIVCLVLLFRSLVSFSFTVVFNTLDETTNASEEFSRSLRIGLASVIVQGISTHAIIWALIILPIRSGDPWLEMGQQKKVGSGNDSAAHLTSPQP